MHFGIKHSLILQGEVSLYGWYPVLLDSTEQEIMLLFVWSKAAKSKSVKLQASRTLIKPYGFVVH